MIESWHYNFIFNILSYSRLGKEQEGREGQEGRNCDLNILNPLIFETQILTLSTQLTLQNAFFSNVNVAWYYNYFISL
jgi:hypothetical protein